MNLQTIPRHRPPSLEELEANRVRYYAQLVEFGHNPKENFETIMGGLKCRVHCKSCKKDFTVKRNFVMDRNATKMTPCNPRKVYQ